MVARPPPGSEKPEIGQIHIHVRGGKNFGCETEIETAASRGVAFEKDLVSGRIELIAQWHQQLKRCQRLCGKAKDLPFHLPFQIQNRKPPFGKGTHGQSVAVRCGDDPCRQLSAERK